MKAQPAGQQHATKFKGRRKSEITIYKLNNKGERVENFDSNTASKIVKKIKEIQVDTNVNAKKA